MKFNKDGSLSAPKKIFRDHILIFQLISELDFPVGKKLLIKILRGEVNERIRRLGLDKKIHFGVLGGYQELEISNFLEFLIRKNLLVVSLEKNRYPVITLSPSAEKEILERKFSFRADEVLVKDFVDKPLAVSYSVSPITDIDKKLFSEFDFFLSKFTDEQKKAIVDSSKKILCIAGAGSGKTSVLTNKIAFLVRFLGVDPNKILAITFTRKARFEMLDRLKNILDLDIRVETFNSFAEKELLSKGHLIYKSDKRMCSNKEFFSIVLQGISNIGFDLDIFLEHYFTSRERRGKEQRELFFSFLYDFRAILDSYYSSGKDENFFKKKIFDLKLSERTTAENILKLVTFVDEELELRGLRTFSNQLIDLIRLYLEFPEHIKRFEWILVDEYQDVNDDQVKLIELINPPNIFVVGDPRQSIYSWRGANSKKIFEFIDKDTSVVELTTNFRSSKSVVNIANEIIKASNRGRNSFHPLKSAKDIEGLVSIVKFSSEDSEAIAVVSQIKELACPRNEIFVLSRTNKGLNKIREVCDREGIRYLIRTDEKRDLELSPSVDQITLSTVHAIKGLEAEIVFVIGANMNNYPCKSKDHRFVELLSSKPEYDSFEEERRLFYVACTRAKKELRISYNGAPSVFLNKNVVACASHSGVEQGSHLSAKKSLDRVEEQRSALKRWRFLESSERNIPAYMIFSDRALEHLLELQPLTIEELLEVNGLGKTKVREFGQDILNILHR